LECDVKSKAAANFYKPRRHVNIREENAAILILPDVQANTRFAPTSDARFRATVGANLVFACSLKAKIRIAEENTT